MYDKSNCADEHMKNRVWLQINPDRFFVLRWMWEIQWAFFVIAMDSNFSFLEQSIQTILRRIYANQMRLRHKPEWVRKRKKGKIHNAHMHLLYKLLFSIKLIKKNDSFHAWRPLKWVLFSVICRPFSGKCFFHILCNFFFFSVWNKTHFRWRRKKKLHVYVNKKILFFLPKTLLTD